MHPCIHPKHETREKLKCMNTLLVIQVPRKKKIHKFTFPQIFNIHKTQILPKSSETNVGYFAEKGLMERVAFYDLFFIVFLFFLIAFVL